MRDCFVLLCMKTVIIADNAKSYLKAHFVFTVYSEGPSLMAVYKYMCGMTLHHWGAAETFR